MSCFIVEDKTYRDIATTLNHFHYANGGKYAIWYTASTPKEQLDRLFRQIHIVNHKAYRERYKHHGPKSGFYSIKHIVNQWGKCLTPAQLVKSLLCIRYQCSEFEPDKEPICLKTLDRIIDDAKMMLIGLNPDFESANWG